MSASYLENMLVNCSDILVKLIIIYGLSCLHHDRYIQTPSIRTPFQVVLVCQAVIPIPHLRKYWTSPFSQNDHSTIMENWP